MVDNFVFITVRLGSSRLSQKAFLPFGNEKSVIAFVIKRCLFASNLTPIICTGEWQHNNKLASIANEYKIPIYFGHENNKMKRWYDCAKSLKIKTFHALDADDPFFDPNRVLLSLDLLALNFDADVVLPSNYSDSGGATEGYSIRTSSLNFLEKFDDFTDTEMVFGILKQNVNCVNFEDPEYRHEKIRMTLDYQEDYLFLNCLAKKFDYKKLRLDIENELIAQYDETPNFFRNLEWKSAQLIKSEKIVNEIYRKK